MQQRDNKEVCQRATALGGDGVTEAAIELALVDMADFFDSKPENTNNTGSKGERNGEDEHPK